MHIAGSSEACALGSAVVASVVGGVHPTVLEAQKAMTRLKPRAYLPDPGAAKIYDRLYTIYKTLHDSLGTPAYVDLVTSVLQVNGGTTGAAELSQDSAALRQIRITNPR